MKIGAATLRPVSLFYSYSHRDEEFRSALETHLSVLRRNRLVAEWHDRMISAGGDWRADIDRNLARADIVLLLVSADFLASDYCWGEEMTKALQRHERGEARVIPVILRPCRRRSTPLANLQAVPKDGKAVTDWLSRDAAFDDVAAAIERIIEDLLQDRLRAEEARRQAEKESLRAEARAAQDAEAQRGADKSDDRTTVPAPPKAMRRWLIAGALVVLVAGGAGWVLVSRDSADRLPADAEKPAVTAAAPEPAPPPPSPPKPALWPGDTFADCENCPQMVVIAGGKFAMGSPETESKPGQRRRTAAMGDDRAVRDEQDRDDVRRVGRLRRRRRLQRLLSR